MTDSTAKTQTPTLTAEDVRGLCGDILDWKVQAILATGGSVADLEAALAWANGLDSVMLDAERPLAGAAAQMYDLIIADEDLAEER